MTKRKRNVATSWMTEEWPIIKTKKPANKDKSKVININDNSERLDFDDIIDYLGEPAKVDKNRAYWQCPDCKDISENNVIYDFNHKILKTFCCDSGKKIFSAIKRKKREHIGFNSSFKSTSELPVNEEIVLRCNDYLLKNEERLNQIKNIRGITKGTIADLKIGFVEESNCWILPNYDLEGKLIGYEFRTQDFKPNSRGRKSWRSQGEAKKLCKINQPVNPKNIIVLEGFLDGYVFYQYLKELNLHNDYQIITPSNGVGFIPDLMTDFDNSRYEKVILFLDNDKQGKKGLNDTVLKVNYQVYQLKFPYLKSYCKDFNEWYLSHKDSGELLKNIKYNALSIAKRFIREDGFNHLYSVPFDGSFSLINQLIVYKNCYYEIGTQGSNICYKRLTNYHIDFKREIVTFDDKGNPNSSLEIQIIDRNGKRSIPFLLEGNSKQDITDFMKNISRYGNYSNLLSKNHLAEIIDGLEDLDKIYYYDKAGLIEDLGLWLYSDSAVNIKTGEIYKADKDGIITAKEIKIKPNMDSRKKPVLNVSNEYTNKELANFLIDSLKNTYSGTIEPFLVIGTAIMAPYKDILKKKTNDGFPVTYSQGVAGSGKTNAAKIICALYGFNETFIISGNSSDNSIRHDLGRLNRLPAIIDELPIKASFEELVKNIYESYSREIMKRDGIDKIEKPINSTAIFISNFYPPDNEQVMSRLNFVSFNKLNFKVDEAKKFNEIRDKHLSGLAPAFLSVPEEKILFYFDDNSYWVKDINPDISPRCANNLAIAYAGIRVLLDIAEINSCSEIEDGFIQYVKNFNDICQVESALDIFLKYLTTLNTNDKIQQDKDYKFTSEGKLAIHLNEQLILAFTKEYKQVTGNNTAPTKKDILLAAKNDPRVEQGKDQVAKPVNFGNEPKRCIVIDITNNEELTNLK